MSLEEVSRNFLKKILEQVEGIIYIGVQNQFIFPIIKKSGVPTVSVLYDLEGFDSVMTDNFQGGKIVAEYLCKLGHKKIGMICGPPHDDNFSERVEGFKKGLREYGVEIKEKFFVFSLYDAGSGYHAMQKFFSFSECPTAIFAGDDILAMGAMKAIYEKKLKIPEDISIVGFDNNPFSAHLIPPLTTVKQPTEEIGKRAMEILVERIKGISQKVHKLRIEPELIIRESATRIKKRKR